MSEVDETESVRRIMTNVINSGAVDDVINNEKTWTTDQLRQEFDVMGFMAPFVTVRRKSDGVEGLMKFRHNPRVYFDFEANNDQG